MFLQRLTVVRSLRHASLLVVAVSILAGCSSVPIPPTYTQDELKAICERHSGKWQPDGIAGGFCYTQPGD
jgi:hypothetical protein